jgi:hypothetical protein
MEYESMTGVFGSVEWEGKRKTDISGKERLGIHFLNFVIDNTKCTQDVGMETQKLKVLKTRNYIL